MSATRIRAMSWPSLIGLFAVTSSRPLCNLSPGMGALLVRDSSVRPGSRRRPDKSYAGGALSAFKNTVAGGCAMSPLSF